MSDCTTDNLPGDESVSDVGDDTDSMMLEVSQNINTTENFKKDLFMVFQVSNTFKIIILRNSIERAFLNCIIITMSEVINIT